MKYLIIISIALVSSSLTFAQTFEFKDHHDIPLNSSHYEYSNSATYISGTKFHIENLTTNPLIFGVKMYRINAPTQTDWQICFGTTCYTASPANSSAQIYVQDTIEGCETYEELKIAPFTFIWQYSDEGIWRVTVYDVANPIDSVSSIITWKYTLAGDVNGDGQYGVSEIAGDVDNNGIIGVGEIAGDINGDGLMLLAGELIGDINGNTIIDGIEVLGDNDGDTSLSGDINSDAIIGVGEISGDISLNGTIDGSELAGDNSGDNLINRGEISGDTSGDGLIGSGEIAGDNSGNGSIDGTELTGDSDGNGIINGEEFLGDNNGNRVLDSGELYGDENGNGIFDGVEIVGDINNDGSITGCEVGYTSVKDVTNEDIAMTVYPNPTSDNLRINYTINEEAKNARIDFYDVLGQEVNTYYLSNNNGQLKINVSSWNSGVYIITIRTDENNIIPQTERIIIK
jgi:hypothetical protein